MIDEQRLALNLSSGLETNKAEASGKLYVLKTFLVTSSRDPLAIVERPT